jgi:hypothetical protein
MKREKGKSMPAVSVTDFSGRRGELSDYKRKRHVVLIHEPGVAPEQWTAWQSAVAADGQRWTWLQAVFARPSMPTDLVAGAYVVSRWGNLVEFYASGAWDFDKIEKDLLYFEAQDCCDLKDAP